MEERLRSHGLTSKDCNVQVSEIHLDKIARSGCAKWRSLPPYLDLPSIVVSNIERQTSDEEERRKLFFSDWKQKKASSATYGRLIEALVEIDCVQDAEMVCTLLKKNQGRPAGQGTARGGQERAAATRDSNLKLPILFKVLLPMAKEWKNIGSLLEVPDDVLDRIEHDYAKAVDNLREMLKEWLKRVDPPPSWNSVAEAVMPFNERIGKKIEEEYC